MATREELTSALDQAMLLLRAQGRTSHALSLERDRAYIVQGDYYGLENLLATLREMGPVSGEASAAATEPATALAEALSRVYRLASRLEAAGEACWPSRTDARAPVAMPERQHPQPRPDEIAPWTLLGGLVVLAFLGVSAWLGSMAMGLFAGLYHQSGSRAQAAGDAAMSGLGTLVGVYLAVFIGYLMNGKGELGIAIGIIAGVAACILVWTVRWLA